MPTLYRRNAEALAAQCRENNIGCAGCGLGFDWSADARSRWAFSADHILPKSLGGTDERNNLRPLHYGCNSARGNGVTRGLGSHNGRRVQRIATRPTTNPRSEQWP